MLFYLSKEAENDLFNIAKYTKDNWGLEQSNLYLIKLDKCFHTIAKYPGIGQLCNNIRQGYRKYPEGKHMIFYHIASDGILEITRIMHQNMHYSKHFPGNYK